MPATVLTSSGLDATTSAGDPAAVESYVAPVPPSAPYTVATGAGDDVTTSAGVPVAVESWVDTTPPSPPAAGSCDVVADGYSFDSYIADGYADATSVSIYEAIYSRLTGSTGLAALVGARIYLDHPPEQWRPSVGPVLCYTVDDDAADLVLDGPDGTSIAQISFDAYGLRKTDTIAVAKQLVKEWNGLSESIGGVEIDYFGHVAGPSNQEVQPDGTDTRIWMTTVQFECGRQLGEA